MKVKLSEMNLNHINLGIAKSLIEQKVARKCLSRNHGKFRLALNWGSVNAYEMVEALHGYDATAARVIYNCMSHIGVMQSIFLAYVVDVKALGGSRLRSILDSTQGKAGPFLQQVFYDEACRRCGCLHDPNILVSEIGETLKSQQFFAGRFSANTADYPVAWQLSAYSKPVPLVFRLEVNFNHRPLRI